MNTLRDSLRTLEDTLFCQKQAIAVLKLFLCKDFPKREFVEWCHEYTTWSPRIRQIFYKKLDKNEFYSQLWQRGYGAAHLPRCFYETWRSPRHCVFPTERSTEYTWQTQCGAQLKTRRGLCLVHDLWLAEAARETQSHLHIQWLARIVLDHVCLHWRELQGASTHRMKLRNH
jgi:hypothetical protein